jgi:hypothetical protein
MQHWIIQQMVTHVGTGGRSDDQSSRKMEIDMCLPPQPPCLHTEQPLHHSLGQAGRGLGVA